MKPRTGNLTGHTCSESLAVGVAPHMRSGNSMEGKGPEETKNAPEKSFSKSLLLLSHRQLTGLSEQVNWLRHLYTILDHARRVV